MPQQLVMFTHLVGLCSPPLQVINLAFRYFKFVVKCMVFKQVFTHQALFPLTFYLVFCVHHSCLLVVPTCVLLKMLQINAPKYLGESVTGMKFGLRKR